MMNAYIQTAIKCETERERERGWKKYGEKNYQQKWTHKKAIVKNGKIILNWTKDLSTNT